jgi:hypothetical protein
MNGVVVTDAIKFVQTNKEKITISSREDPKESREPDYDEDQIEEEQEEETEELNEEIANNVFYV